jgi:AAA15 family ATPase/GTPase
MLHLEGLENVNLIGGKNNVGKTAFLKAVELLVSSNDPYGIIDWDQSKINLIQ